MPTIRKNEDFSFWLQLHKKTSYAYGLKKSSAFIPCVDSPFRQINPQPHWNSGESIAVPAPGVFDVAVLLHALLLTLVREPVVNR